MDAVVERPIPVNLDASAFSFYSSGVFDESHCGTVRQLRQRDMQHFRPVASQALAV